MIDNIGLEYFNTQRIGHFLRFALHFHIEGQDRCISEEQKYKKKEDTISKIGVRVIISGEAN